LGDIKAHALTYATCTTMRRERFIHPQRGCCFASGLQVQQNQSATSEEDDDAEKTAEVKDESEDTPMVDVECDNSEKSPAHQAHSPLSVVSPASKEHYEQRSSQLTPTDGSVRSDEGYHSNGYHDDAVFTPPEDSSDSDSENNYVLDFR
jgi:hypothetical protein